MKTEVAKYFRGAISLITVVACLFFPDKLAISGSMQTTLLISIFTFYLGDYVKGIFDKPKK